MIAQINGWWLFLGLYIFTISLFIGGLKSVFVEKFRKYFWISLAGVLIGILLITGPLYMNGIYEVEIPYKSGYDLFDEKNSTLVLDYNLYIYEEPDRNYAKTGETLCYNFTISNGSEEYDLEYLLAYKWFHENKGEMTQESTTNFSIEFDEDDVFKKEDLCIRLKPGVYITDFRINETGTLIDEKTGFAKNLDNPEYLKSNCSSRTNQSYVTVLTLSEHADLETQKSLIIATVFAGIPAILYHFIISEGYTKIMKNSCFWLSFLSASNIRSCYLPIG